MRAEDILSRARARLLKARLLLHKGRAGEACVVAWRATVEAINAVTTALWGERGETPSRLGKLVEKLYVEGIVDVRSEFCNAYALHEDPPRIHLTPLIIEANIKKVEELIDKIADALKRSPR
ncbi:MAG: hypothetical protein DRJ67_05145 [Thermoprotei archaeon]|nr:MAG: hypothetical protein DRJ67_05145 [Thermoprotei archaeon]